MVGVFADFAIFTVFSYYFRKVLPLANAVLTNPTYIYRTVCYNYRCTTFSFKIYGSTGSLVNRHCSHNTVEKLPVMPYYTGTEML